MHKNHATDASEHDILSTAYNDEQRRDCAELLTIMREETGLNAQLWGDRLIGFGNYQYRYPSGREGRWFYTGFSARKKNLSISINNGLHNYKELLARLGKHKIGSACLYVTNLSDIHIPTLREIIRLSVADMRRKYE